MNEYDSNRIYDFAKQINYYKTKNFKDVDCFVLNTCHIREKATDKVYHEIGRIKKEYRNKKKTNSSCSWLCRTSRRRDNFKKRKLYKCYHWASILSRV